MSQKIATIANHIPKDAEWSIQSRKLADRAAELSDYSRMDYHLTSTHVIDTPEATVFVDTFTANR